MSQLMSVRSNQDFGLNHESGKLVPQTEVVVLVEKPSYVVKGTKIIRESKVEEFRFKCGSEGIGILIDQLQAAQRNMVHFENMAEVMNEFVVKAKAPEGEVG